MVMPEDSGAAQQSRNNAAIDELIEANSSSNATMLALVESVRRETEARDRKVDMLEKNHQQMNWVIVGVGVLVVIMLGLGITNAINLAATKDQQNQTRQINTLLLDCVNSTGACGQANAVQQAKILDTVKQYELTGFYCARTNPANVDPDGEDFLKCMNRLYPGGPTLSGR